MRFLCMEEARLYYLCLVRLAGAREPSTAPLTLSEPFWGGVSEKFGSLPAPTNLCPLSKKYRLVVSSPFLKAAESPAVFSVRAAGADWAALLCGFILTINSPVILRKVSFIFVIIETSELNGMIFYVLIIYCSCLNCFLTNPKFFPGALLHRFR